MKNNLCDCDYMMLDAGWYKFCTKCGKSKQGKGFRAWLIRLLIKSYKINKNKFE